MSEVKTKKNTKKGKPKKGKSTTDVADTLQKSQKNVKQEDRKQDESQKTDSKKLVKPLKKVEVPSTPVLWVYKYFCCFCILPRKFRKNKRKIEADKLKEQELADAERLLQEAIVPLPIEESIDIQATAALKIQALIRGFQGRQIMKEYWKEAISKENSYWLAIVRARELAWLEKERAIVARKQFVLQYVTDIFQTSLIFFSQTSEASTDIQRIWRGHRTRSRIIRPLPPKPKRVRPRPSPKVIPKSRFTVDTLRRVWSRKNYQPANGKWLHTTDFGRLEYNMWEYVDNPPIGSNTGMRINKVHAVARNEREKEALVRDRHAWVGLPVGYETIADAQLKREQTVPMSVTNLKLKSPYNAAVINWDRFDEYAEEEKRKKLLRIQKSKEKRNNKTKKKGYNSNNATTTDNNSSSNMMYNSSGQSSKNNSDYEEDKQYDSNTSPSETDEEEENRRKHRHKQKTKVRKKRTLLKQTSESKHMEIHEGASSNTNTISSPFSKPLNEKEFVKKLEKFGYNSAAMDPVESRGLPRIGTYAYDPQTGRYIIHKGNNRWVGVHDDTFIVQYEMPAKAIAYDEAKAAAEQDSSSEDEMASLRNTATVTTNNNNSSKGVLDRFGDRSLVNLQPRVQHHRSGAVTVSNPSLLNKKSRFLRQHRSIFLDNFTHHNLSEYSGLLSSTYFDLTIHAKGLAHGYPLLDNSLKENSGIEDDDASDFNFIQSNQPSPYFYNKEKKRNQIGFVQSFLTDAASSLAHSHIESKKYPENTNSQSVTAEHSQSVATTYNSNVRYTTEGYPIRGARKPYTGPIQLLQGVTTPSITAYDLITDSYKGGSQNSNTSQNNSYKYNNNKLSNSLNYDNTDNNSTAEQSIKKSFTEDSWRTSAWGKLKHGVQNFVHAAGKDPTLKNHLYNAVTEPSQNFNYNNNQQRDVEVEENNDEIDSDEEMWRSRSIYKVNKNETIKVGSVYPKKPKINYKLRYTWIPQPLVHNAVNNLYYQKTIWDYRNQLNDKENNSNIHKEIYEKKEKNQKKIEKQSMLSITTEKKPSLDIDYLYNNEEEYSSMKYSKEKEYSLYHENVPGSSTGGYGPPSAASSVASSKYYKHFIENNQQSPSNISMTGHSNRSNGKTGSGVMITALMDDNSSVGSASADEDKDLMHDQINTGVDSAAEDYAEIEADQYRLLKKGSNFSYTLLQEDEQSAQYDVQSPTGSSSWVSSPQQRSLQGSPIAHKKELQVETEDPEPEKTSIYQFPSPLPSHGDVQQPDSYNGLQAPSGWSSPGASISTGTGIPSPAPIGGGVIRASSLYSSNSEWDATAETPTGSFYSPKGAYKGKSSLKTSALQPKPLADGAEHTQRIQESNYHAERPAGLTKQTSKKVYFIDHTTDSSDHVLQLQSNHYLDKNQRDQISLISTQYTESTSEKSPHLVLQAPEPPHNTVTKTGGYATKFKFKPDKERSHSFNAEEALAAVTFPRTPKNLRTRDTNTTNNTTTSSKYISAKSSRPSELLVGGNLSTKASELLVGFNLSTKASRPSELPVGGNLSTKASRPSELPVGGNLSTKSARSSSPPKMNSINEDSAKLGKREGSAKRLRKQDSIHPYHFS